MFEGKAVGCFFPTSGLLWTFSMLMIMFQILVENCRIPLPAGLLDGPVDSAKPVYACFRLATVSPEPPCGPALREHGLDGAMRVVPSRFVGESFCEKPDDQNIDQEELVILPEQTKRCVIRSLDLELSCG